MIGLIYVLAILFTLGFLAGSGTLLMHRLETLKTKKQTLVPKTNFPEVGVCQCGDAFCYHGNGPCQIDNCPCTIYIPSTATEADLNTFAVETLNKLMLNTAAAKTEYENARKDARQAAITARRRDYY